MNEKLAELLQMTREAALYAGNVASRGIDAATNKTGDILETARLNKEIFDLGTTTNALLLDLGELVYQTHRGNETDPDELQILLEQIDCANEELNAIRDHLSELKNERSCPACGEKLAHADKFCKYCGQELD